METRIEMIDGPSSQNLFVLTALIALVFAPPMLFYAFRSWIPTDTAGHRRLLSRLSVGAFIWMWCALGVAIGAALTF